MATAIDRKTKSKSIVRAVLGHGPNGHTFERNYENKLYFDNEIHSIMKSIQ